MTTPARTWGAWRLEDDALQLSTETFGPESYFIELNRIREELTTYPWPIHLAMKKWCSTAVVLDLVRAMEDQGVLVPVEMVRKAVAESRKNHENGTVLP